MRSLLLIGGLIGFATGLVFSWAQESAWPASLWHACLAAYVMSLLMKWWGQSWRKNLEQALLEQQAAASTPLNLASAAKGSKS